MVDGRALACVAHIFVLRAFGAEYQRDSSALQVSPQLSACALEGAAYDVKDSRPWRSMQQARERWCARLPEVQSVCLGWLSAPPPPDLVELLELCGALTVNALPSAGAKSHASAPAEALGREIVD